MGSARPTGMIFSPSDQERFREIAHGARAAALKQCLPLGLIVAIAVGLAAPVVGQAFASVRLAGFGVLDTLCVWLIFFISGLTLKTEDAKQALAAWRALLWSLFAILGATPLVAPLASRIPPPFPREFALGFAIFCAMPTTINTGVALTVQAKGSFALALVITVSTNLLAVFTVPFYLSAVLQLAAVAIDPVQLLAKLLMLILLPLLAGKGTRELSAAARRLAAARKQQLSLCSNAALVLVPWMKLSQSAGALRSASAPSLLLVLLLALAIHLLFLGFNLAGSRALKLPDEQLRAVVIMGSQKTLPMALAVLAALPPELGAPGLIAVPCIVAHILQIFVDAFIATRWSHQPPRPARAAGRQLPAAQLSSESAEAGEHETVEIARPLAQQPHAPHGGTSSSDYAHHDGTAADGAGGKNGGSAAGDGGREARGDGARPQEPGGSASKPDRRQLRLLDDDEHVGKGRSDDHERHEGDLSV